MCIRDSLIRRHGFKGFDSRQHAAGDLPSPWDRVLAPMDLNEDIQLGARTYGTHFSKVGLGGIDQRGIAGNGIGPHEDHDGPLPIIRCATRLELWRHSTLRSNSSISRTIGSALPLR